MIKLNDELLEELGLGSLPPEEKKKILAHIYETLEMRVGMKLAEQMTDAQLDEFEQFINRNDEAGALRWLETNFPHYKDVVAQEFEALKLEVRQAAPQILAAAQQAQAATQFPQQQPAAAFQPQQPPVAPPAYPQQQYPPQPAFPQQPYSNATPQPQRHLRSVPNPDQPQQPYYPYPNQSPPPDQQQPPQMPAAA